MERLAEPHRFGAGEKLARTGKVPAILFDGRTIAARVQCADEPPYTVRISVDPFSAEQWGRLLAGVRDWGRLAAHISAGELPLEIQTAYTKAGLRFMPERYTDLHLECPCPDWLKPCKHLVAVWMKFARDFDHNPALLFEIRGLKRDSVLAMLWNRPGTASEEQEALEETPVATVPCVPESLPSDPSAFWFAPPLPVMRAEAAERNSLDEDIFERLRDWKNLEPQLSQIYDAVYELATRVRK
jgi:uncharacterized Zn finger protein